MRMLTVLFERSGWSFHNKCWKKKSGWSNWWWKSPRFQKLYLASLLVTLLTKIIVIKIMTIITRVSSAGKARTLWRTQVRLSMRASLRWEQSTRGRRSIIIRIKDLYMITIFLTKVGTDKKKLKERYVVLCDGLLIVCSQNQAVSCHNQYHHLCKYLLIFANIIITFANICIIINTASRSTININYPISI